jgi:hypothetical protein
MVGLGEYGRGTSLGDWTTIGELWISGDDALVLVLVLVVDVVAPSDPLLDCSSTSPLCWCISGCGHPTTGTGMSLCTGLTSCQQPLCSVTNAEPSSLPGS